MIWGKPNQTLLGHVTDCLFAINARINLDELVLKAVCAERLKADWEEVLACLRYIAVMHDIGKATDAWQEEQYARIKAKSNNPLVTHAIPSAFIIAQTLQLGASSGANTPKHAAALAVLGHHGQLHDGSASETSLRQMRLLPEGWAELSELSAKTSSFDSKPFPTDRPFQLGKMGGEFKDWKKMPRREAGLHFKGLYCLMSALLRTCDTEASIYAGKIPEAQASFENPGGPFLTNSNDMKMLQDWREVMLADVLNGRAPYRIQARANELNDLCDLLNAGCGEGKTAFALLHAQHLMRQGKINRVIFTLPTKFTSNNMYRDFLDLKQYQLPAKYVGLFHGDSRLFLKQEMPDEEEEKTNLILADLQQQNRVYHRPVTISTVDHLLMSFYHGYKYADWAFGNILQSLVVFDELHHYETLTVSAINEALKVLRLLRVPHLIMTATIPDTRISILNSRSPGDKTEKYTPLVSDGREETPVEGEERRVKKSFIFRKCTEQMVWAVREDKQTRYEIADSLLKDLVEHQCLRQIIFVNQVEKAKAVAKAVSQLSGLSEDCEIICYHAEFIGKDRLAKEECIRDAFKKNEIRPCILIATQIAELSLDISADRMYSEIAPLDDIVQRGGRLNRNGITPFLPNGQQYEMVVYALNFDDERDVLPYVKIKKSNGPHGQDIPHLLRRSWDILPHGAEYCFENVRNWVNALYGGIEPLEHINFREAVRADTVFGSKPQDHHSERDEEDGGRVALRTKEFETFDVIPHAFEAHLTENRDNNRDLLLIMTPRIRTAV